jgi:hypothetical protein
MRPASGAAVACITVVGLSLSAFATAQDIRRIDDRSLTRERHERAVHALLEIEGQKLELVFRRETVPGAVFLTVTHDGATTTYRYLGYDERVIRFRVERGGRTEPAVLTYAAKPSGGFVVIPEELQYTRLQFEVTAVAERGAIHTVLLDNGQPR